MLASLLALLFKRSAAGLTTVLRCRARSLTRAAATAVTVMWAGVATSGGGFCSPPALGAPCAMGGIATQGASEPLPGLVLGNPIHLANGNKYQLDVDLPANASAPGLELVRHYNGLSIQTGPLGRNWTLSYDTRLQKRHDGWLLRQADGSTRKISAPIPTHNGHAWNWPDGRQLQFDSSGRLVGIRISTTAAIHIQRHTGPPALAGLIHRVGSTSGYALEFEYETDHGQVLLKSVNTPLGRFHYGYEPPPAKSAYKTARLTWVLRPDGMQRLYHYEAELQAGNPYALTGISLQDGDEAAQRQSTWQFDRHGRVTSLYQHGRPAPPLQVDYVRSAQGTRPGLTRVRHGQQILQNIRFQRTADGYRLLSRNSNAQDITASDTTYDAFGRIIAFDGLRLRRDREGRPAAVTPHTPGWPGLSMELSRQAGQFSWRTNVMGRTVLKADTGGRPGELHYANGDTIHIRHDMQGRPIQLQHKTPRAKAPYITHLLWKGRQLQRIEHPFETEHRQYDVNGRLSHRRVERPAILQSAHVRYEESFRYDADGRLTQHLLPEGGALHYRWRTEGHPHGTLAALHWEDAQGQLHHVVSSIAGRPGYRFSNGLQLLTLAKDGRHADTLLLTHKEQTVWLQERRYDAHGRLQDERHVFPEARHFEELRFVYDTQSRMQGARLRTDESSTHWWYAWHDTGQLAASRRYLGASNAKTTLVPHVYRDASGLPLEFNDFRLHYGPHRRLEAVRSADSGEPIAQYRHNAFGHRIAKQTADGTTHFLYVGNRLVAEARSRDALTSPTVSRRYLYAGLTPVGVIIYPPGEPAELYAVHSDLSGAPRLITDIERKVRWRAGYTPTGQVQRLQGDLEFALRLPGQIEDKETGWHDNLLRTYLPAAGHYLEADPYGPMPGSDAFGYARQQPWRYADPLGLLLFAFDGTRYSAESMGNTWILAQAYRDGAAHYHSGPGNSYFLDWDAIVAWRAGRILENQWQALLTALEHQPAGMTVPVDIIGFSRGAALARHFANRIASHVQQGVFRVNDPMRGLITACVDLRFMGLFDTVAQFGIAGSHNHLYDFGVSKLWSWVAHAVALHEHRWAFALTSADSGGSGNVVEAPFVGAHADIGGGLALLAPEPSEDAALTSQAQSESDLAKVALAWMHWQALAASVDFDTLEEADTRLQSPLLRDLRSPLMRSVLRGDRAVTPPGASSGRYQDELPRLGRNTREAVEAFITRVPGWRSNAGDVVGTVDMEGYSRWLEDTLGWAP